MCIKPSEYKFIIKINRSTHIIASNAYTYEELKAITKFAQTLPESIHVLAYDNNGKLVLDNNESTY